MPTVDPKPTIVIHTNDQQMIAALVSAHSLKSRSKTPERFDVRLLRLEETLHLYKRDKQELHLVEWGPAFGLALARSAILRSSRAGAPCTESRSWMWSIGPG